MSLEYATIYTGTHLRSFFENSLNKENSAITKFPLYAWLKLLINRDIFADSSFR